jgi:serine/threonine-protein kinase
LEGIVRRSGVRLRITVQLVNAADGYQLWSERYDREMTDVFEVQDDIANAIAGRLRGAIQGDADRARSRHGTQSVEAYESFLRGRTFQYQRGGAVSSAIRCFEQAIAPDPGYAEALAWLSDSYRLLGTYGVAPASEVMPKSRAAEEEALAIDPDLPEALSTLADVEMLHDRAIARATAHWTQVLESNPRCARARCERALWLIGPGDLTPARAVEEARRAANDEPLNAWVAGMSTYMLGFAQRYDEAVAEAKRAAGLDSDSFLARFSLLQAHAWSGDYAAALEVAPAILATSGRHVWALGTVGWVYAKAGHPEEARVFDELEARSRHEFVSPFWLAAFAAAVGRAEDARRYAERAALERDAVVMLGRVLPQWDLVRAIPGFDELVGEVWG